MFNYFIYFFLSTARPRCPGNRYFRFFFLVRPGLVKPVTLTPAMCYVLHTQMKWPILAVAQSRHHWIDTAYSCASGEVELGRFGALTITIISTNISKKLFTRMRRNALRQDKGKRLVRREVCKLSRRVKVVRIRITILGSKRLFWWTLPWFQIYLWIPFWTQSGNINLHIRNEPFYWDLQPCVPLFVFQFIYDCKWDTLVYLLRFRIGTLSLSQPLHPIPLVMAIIPRSGGLSLQS